MLVGQEAPDAGLDRRSATPSQLSYVDQSRDDLAADKTVFQEITQGAEVIKVGARELPGPRLRVAASTSAARTSRSSSASCRAASATASTSPSCSSRAATSCCSTSRRTTSTSTRSGRSRPGLESFPGCVVVISHDRWFLDRIATHILAFEGDSQVRWFEGNVSDYEAFRHKELGTAADQPHRIRYKRLVA